MTSTSWTSVQCCGHAVAAVGEAAESPQTVIDGSHCLRTSLEAGKLRTTPHKQPTASAKRRASRAKLDLERIRAAIDADAELKALMHEMLSAAFTAMALGVRNHAAGRASLQRQHHTDTACVDGRHPTHFSLS